MKNYIVFDLEWNQPSGRDEAIEGLPFEIVEIGAVKLDEDLQPVSEFHRLIRPQLYLRLHPIIAGVTHLTDEELDRKGQPFSRVIDEFFSWCGSEPFYCTWGSMDLTELERNMTHYGIELPFPRPLLFYDVQKLYSLCCSDGKTRESLDHAVKEAGLSCDTPFHRALDDARYTALLLQKLDLSTVDRYVSVDYFRAPRDRSEELRLEFPDYAKFVSRVFPTREDAMADKAVTDVVCRKCHRLLRKKIRWFSYAQRYYLCLASCPEHGLVRAKIRMKRDGNGELFAIRTEKFTDADGAALIAQKKEETRKRRAEHARNRVG